MLNVDGNIFRNAYTRISVNVEGSFRLPNSGETLADEVSSLQMRILGRNTFELS